MCYCNCLLYYLILCYKGIKLSKWEIVPVSERSKLRGLGPGMVRPHHGGPEVTGHADGVRHGRAVAGVTGGWGVTYGQ